MRLLGLKYVKRWRVYRTVYAPFHRVDNAHSPASQHISIQAVNTDKKNPISFCVFYILFGEGCIENSLFYVGLKEMEEQMCTLGSRKPIQIYSYVYFFILVSIHLDFWISSGFSTELPPVPSFLRQRSVLLQQRVFICAAPSNELVAAFCCCQ